LAPFLNREVTHTEMPAREFAGYAVASSVLNSDRYGNDVSEQTTAVIIARAKTVRYEQDETKISSWLQLWASDRPAWPAWATLFVGDLTMAWEISGWAQFAQVPGAFWKPWSVFECFD
jgi:hypothetical protein